MQVTPQRVTMGKHSDLNGVVERKEAKGKTVAWVYARAKPVGGNAPLDDLTPMEDVSTLSQGGTRGTKLLVIGHMKNTPKDCVDEDAVQAWKKNEAHTICQPFLVPKDKKVTRVTLSEGFSKKPLKWQVN